MSSPAIVMTSKFTIGSTFGEYIDYLERSDAKLSNNKLASLSTDQLADASLFNELEQEAKQLFQNEGKIRFPNLGQRRTSNNISATFLVKTHSKRKRSSHLTNAHVMSIL